MRGMLAPKTEDCPVVRSHPERAIIMAIFGMQTSLTWRMTWARLANFIPLFACMKTQMILIPSVTSFS